jgi:murein DD-endopeptidase MepM/ murein hydrolase activator NlpD
MRDRKYVLDPNDLQYKQVETSKSVKVLRIFFWFLLTVGLTILYGTIFENRFGAPKDARLQEEIESLKLDFSIANKELETDMETINNLITNDEVSYRPILEMEGLPESYRNPGVGGVERYRELDGYSTSYIMKSTRMKIDEMKNMLEVQEESMADIESRYAEWDRMLSHRPSICPVQVSIRKGDGLMFREVHPVLGVSQYHNGLDFKAPIGTEVYATGDGQVFISGYNGGFGKCVEIDHDYGYKTIYGHLNEIVVTKGQNVKRGDLIGYSGNTGTSTGPHLHYEIRQYGKVKDPYNYFYDNINEEEYEEMIRAMEASNN